MESKAEVGDRDRAAQKAQEGDDTQTDRQTDTDTHTSRPSYDDDGRSDDESGVVENGSVCFFHYAYIFRNLKYTIIIHAVYSRSVAFQ